MTKYNPYDYILGDVISPEWFDIDSPVPQTISDHEDIREAVQQFSLIPMYGNTSTSSFQFLEHLSEMCRLSPSFNSAIADMNSFAFGLDFDVRPTGVPGLLLPEEEDVAPLPYEEKVTYATALNGYGIQLPKIIHLSKLLHRHLRTCGNAFLRVYRVNVGGSVRYSFQPVHYMHGAYLRTLDPPFQFLVISRKWTLKYMSENPPTILPVTYPQDSEIKWLNDQAVIHLKREIGSDTSEYYGRSEIISCYDWLAADIFGASVISKIAATEITAKNIFAFQGPNPNAMREPNDDEEFIERMAAIRSLTTNQGHRGEAKSLAGFEYPFGADPPIKLSLDVARDTEFAQFTQDYAANTIYSALNWSTQMSGFREVRTGLGSNVLRDLLITKQVSTIEPIQHEFENMWNWLIMNLLEEVNFTGERHYLAYRNTVDSMIEKLGGVMSSSSPTNSILNDPIQ